MRKEPTGSPLPENGDGVNLPVEEFPPSRGLFPREGWRRKRATPQTYRQTRMPGNQDRPYGKSRQAPPWFPLERGTPNSPFGRRCRGIAFRGWTIFHSSFQGGETYKPQTPPSIPSPPTTGRRNACRARRTHRRAAGGLMSAADADGNLFRDRNADAAVWEQKI